MGSSSSTDTAAASSKYDFISIAAMNLNPKLSSPLWKMKLCRSSGGTAATTTADIVVAIPKYWSMRARAVFLTRLLPNGKRLARVTDGVAAAPTEWISEPDLATLEELERLPR